MDKKCGDGWNTENMALASEWSQGWLSYSNPQKEKISPKPMMSKLSASSILIQKHADCSDPEVSSNKTVVMDRLENMAGKMHLLWSAHCTKVTTKCRYLAGDV